MQFVANGPDIPERLLQAHEDGRVVFFCGAGISYPAGLPGFKGLVEKLYEGLNATPDAEQQAAIRAKRFDTAIGLLENKIVGGRERVRKALAGILTPNSDASDATATHEALLALSRNREEQTRLVTTNFDRLFEKAIADADLSVARFQAPQLPVPKRRWDGLVYLHGLLPEEPSAQELDHLVVSSGDFGRAYLDDGWAARFAGELFRNYTVCFVGYSLDDPVLRYMTDALAADRPLGEPPPEMFAFGSHSKGKENEQANRWRAKNVTPILYREHRRHQHLHRTLREWAATYRDGIAGKERIVTRHAGKNPSESTSQDDFVGRLLWALSDPSGLPARRFAGHDPVPSLDWLEPLGEQRYGRTDLDRFGVTPHAGESDKLAFSLIRRPSPYGYAPWMTLMDESVGIDGWDEVMRHLARWLLRHLDDPKLLLWLAERGGQLHPGFIWLIEWRLKELDELESGGSTDELDRIRSDAPGPAMRTLWRLMLAGRMRSPSSTLDIYQWRNRFERDGLTAALRLELRHLLTPRISLGEPFPLGGGREDRSEPERIEALVDWRIVLSSDDVHPALHDLRESPRWLEVLPGLLDDLDALLWDAMDLMRELGGADDRSDPSYLHQPSIEAHPQNEGFRDWTALIELTRDAWAATAKIAPERARLVAQAWRLAKYPVFRRLAFFAATHRGVIPPRQAFDWLLIDERWWLWSMETRREAMRLLVALSPEPDGDLLTDLEQAVLAGPPRSMYRDDLEDERWTQTVEREIWLFLAKMKEAGAPLGTDARAKFDQLTSRHPYWRLQEEDRDEFPFFWTEGWIEDIGEPKKPVATPRRRRDLVEWLKRDRREDFWQKDDWPQRCRDDFPTTACALCALARDGAWPPRRWHKALRAWSEEDLIGRSWRYMAPVLAAAPDDDLRLLSRDHDFGKWLKNAAKTFDRGETMFFGLCRRILKLDDRGAAGKGIGDALTQAINHPVGHVTEALLHWWFRSPLEDEQGLPDELKSIFTGLCDTGIGKFRHGRVLMAVRVITLFRVDREWTTRNLLPLFEWRRNEDEARAVWEGFLRSPSPYRPLMESIRQPFLDTARRYGALGRCGRQYAALLVSVSLDRGDAFTKEEREEFAAATAALPEEGLRHTADLLARILDGLGDRRAAYWRNRVLPYLKKIWPQLCDRRTPAISEGLGRICIAAQDEFPEALKELRPWLQTPQYPDRLIRQLSKSGLCQKFPEPALAFLALIAGGGFLWQSGLKECLEQIQSAAFELKEDRRFRVLRDRLRQFGQELE